MILRDSQFKGNATLAAVQELAGEGLQRQHEEKAPTDAGPAGEEHARRLEFIQLVEKAKLLKGP